MKMKMRPRYYCDHCGKASGSPTAMHRHELSCTKNPKRTCRLCIGINGGTGYLEEGKAAFMDPALGNDWKVRMDALREATDNCPCCILAVLRQTGATAPSEGDEDGPGGFAEGMHWKDCRGSHALLGFDFKAEMEGAMAEFAENANANRGCY